MRIKFRKTFMNLYYLKPIFSSAPPWIKLPLDASPIAVRTKKNKTPKLLPISALSVPSVFVMVIVSYDSSFCTTPQISSILL